MTGEEARAGMESYIGGQGPPGINRLLNEGVSLASISSRLWVGLGFQCYSALGLGASSLRTEGVLCWNIYCASYT